MKMMSYGLNYGIDTLLLFPSQLIISNDEENAVVLRRIKQIPNSFTVYHDIGNSNLSLFTPRVRYSRRYNLDIIFRALYRDK